MSRVPNDPVGLDDLDEDAEVLSFTANSAEQQTPTKPASPPAQKFRIPPPKLDVDELEETAARNTAPEASFNNDAEYPENYEDAERVNRLILTWAFLAKWGEQMWLFTVPMVLISIFSISIMPVAVYACFNKLACMLFASNVGAWLDQQGRSKVMHISLLAQICSLVGAGFFLYLLIYQYTEDSAGFNSMSSGISFLCLVVTSIIGSLGTIALTRSIENDWIPAITPGVHLVSMRSKIAGVTLACEVFAPMFVALLLISGWFSSYLTIVILIFVMYFPQYFILRSVVKARPQLYQSSNKTEIQDAMTNPFSVFYNNFSLLKQNSTSWLVLANFFITFNIMSSNLVLIAFLRWAELSFVGIALFQGLYALLNSAAFGSGIYHPLTGRLGLASASNVYLFLHILPIFIATIIFGAQFSSPGGKYAFLLMVAFSAFGHYGFRAARAKYLDEKFGGALPGAEDKKKKIMNLDNASANLSVLCLLAFAMFDGNPQKFIVLVVISFLCLVFGMILNILWTIKSRGSRLPPVIVQH